MLVKLYWLMWVVGIMAAAGLYFTGYLTPLMVVAFGFLTFGAIFMGMMSVLPATVTHHPAEKH